MTSTDVGTWHLGRCCGWAATGTTSPVSSVAYWVSCPEGSQASPPSLLPPATPAAAHTVKALALQGQTCMSVGDPPPLFIPTGLGLNPGATGKPISGPDTRLPVTLPGCTLLRKT